VATEGHYSPGFGQVQSDRGLICTGAAPHIDRRPRGRRLLQFRLLVGKIGPQRDLIKGSKTFFGTIVQRDPD